MDNLTFNFAAVFVFVIVAVVFIYAGLGAGALVRPRKPGAAKLGIYECGEPTIGSSWVRYNVRFYMIALVFLVFDVEVAFLFPVATAMRWFKENGLGLLVFGEVATFVAILMVGFAYAWRYGNLDWVKSGLETQGGLEPLPASNGGGIADIRVAMVAEAQRKDAEARADG